MTLKNLTLAVTALSIAALAAPVLAVPDVPFMKTAVQGGMAEVALGHLAAQRGASPGVRQFGMQMVRDHSEANHALMRIARRESVALPHGLGPKNDALRARLSRLHGYVFDRAYIRAMIADHREDIAEFQHESRRGHNPAVRTFAGKYLPVIEGHLMMVQDLRRKGA